jgi:hypothetical protein
VHGSGISASFVQNLLAVELNTPGACLRKMKVDLREVRLKQQILERTWALSAKA